MQTKSFTYSNTGDLAKSVFFSGETIEKRSTEQKIGFSSDHLGNTRVVYEAEWDKSASQVKFNLKGAYDYFPYGKILRSYVPGNGYERYLTTGHERDHETISENNAGTGFDYRFARMSDSEVPKFNSIDPAAAEYPSWSPYAYVMGNPIMFTDPDGKRADWYQSIGNPSADAVWFEGSNNIKGYSRLGEFRVFNNVTNIPGKYVYFDFMGVTSDYDGGVPNRSGGGGYNLTTDKDLVDGNASNMKGNTNIAIESVNMDEFTSLSRALPPGTNYAKEGFDLLKSLIEGLGPLIPESNQDRSNMNEGDSVKIKGQGRLNFNTGYVIDSTSDGGIRRFPSTQEELEKFPQVE